MGKTNNNNNNNTQYYASQKQKTNIILLGCSVCLRRDTTATEALQRNNSLLFPQSFISFFNPLSVLHGPYISTKSTILARDKQMAHKERTNRNTTDIIFPFCSSDHRRGDYLAQTGFLYKECVTVVASSLSTAVIAVNLRTIYI